MKNANRPAFPSSIIEDVWNEEKGGYVEKEILTGGLTKREEMAKCAMQGILAGIYSSLEMSQIISDSAAKAGLDQDEILADIALEYADALLKKLEEKKP